MSRKRLGEDIGDRDVVLDQKGASSVTRRDIGLSIGGSSFIFTPSGCLSKRHARCNQGDLASSAPFLAAAETPM